MSDCSELKRLALEAQGIKGPIFDMDGPGELCRLAEFVSENPESVLALIAEVEGLRHGWYSDECCNIRFWPEELSESKQEVDRLEAEVEALRAQVGREKRIFDMAADELVKDAERYRWLRDKSEALHSFYLSVPIWMTGVKFNQDTVDSTIDAMRKEAKP